MPTLALLHRWRGRPTALTAVGTRITSRPIPDAAPTSGHDGKRLPRSQFCFKNASPYIGSVTYSSAASEPAFDFDTPLSCWLARIVVSDIADWASSGTDEAVSLSFEGCESPPSDVRRATTAESPMTSDGFVSGPTPSRLAAIALRRFTKRVDETVARSAIRMMIA